MRGVRDDTPRVRVGESARQYTREGVTTSHVTAGVTGSQPSSFLVALETDWECLKASYSNDPSDLVGNIYLNKLLDSCTNSFFDAYAQRRGCFSLTYFCYICDQSWRFKQTLLAMFKMPSLRLTSCP